MNQRQKHSRHPSSAGAPASAALSTSSAGSSFVEWVTIGLLVLVPIAFSRWTEDAWDFPKGILLTVGAMLLGGWVLAAELAGLQRLGFVPWARSLGPRLGSLIRRDRVGGAMILFVISSALSTLLSSNPGLGLHGVRNSYSGFLVAVATATVYFASRSLSTSPTWFRRLCVSTAIAAAFASLYGIIQFFGRDPISWGMVPFLRGMRRAAGTLGQPNLLGCYVVMALPLIAWLVVQSKSWSGRAAWGATGVFSLVALGMTFSRGSWMAFGVAVIVGLMLLVWTRPAENAAAKQSRYRTARAVTIGLVALLAIGGFVTSRTPMGSNLVARAREIASLREKANASRIESWRLGTLIGASKPLIGIGTDQFGMEFPAYRTPMYYRLEFGSIPMTAHNQAVNLFATQGVLGLLAGVLIVVFTAHSVWRLLRRREPWLHGATVAAATALSAFLFWDLVNYTVAALGTLAAALTGWVTAAADSPRSESETAPAARRISRPAWAVAVAGLAMVLAAIPLVVRPVLAQNARREAMREADASPRQIERLKRAAAWAPWEERYQHHLAGAYATAAFAQPDVAGRVDLLNQARLAAEKAIQADPRAALSRARYAWILAHLSLAGVQDIGVDRIRHEFEQAIARDPANPNILEFAAETWLMFRRHDDARAAALQCVRLYPDYARPLSFIGLIALREKRWGDAADTLRLAAERNWRGDQKLKAFTLNNLSAAYIELGRFQDARSAAGLALQNDPELEAASQNWTVATEGLEAGTARPK